MRQGFFLAATLIAGSLLLGAPALAQAGHHGHGQQGHGQHGHGQHGQGAATGNAASRAFRAANEKMHRDMDIPLTGNADVDFARGMIPHHQGAIDMARIALEHGADPEIRKLAEEIIAAQESEIAFLKSWLAKRGY